MSKSIQGPSGFMSQTPKNSSTQDEGLRRAIKDAHDIKLISPVYNLGQCVRNKKPVNCIKAASSVMDTVEIGERIQIMNDPYIQHMPKDDPKKALEYGLRHNFPIPPSDTASNAIKGALIGGLIGLISGGPLGLVAGAITGAVGGSTSTSVNIN